ncbi:MAG TPA: DNA-directed RNA polymerase subunit omega [Chitinophagales bacterium]|nr:DNA-directed RNA polymerase subunit omega [Chitinophagales bacterium]
MKKLQTQTASPYIETRDLDEITKPTGNLYKSISIISKRAHQINLKTREELHAKLNEFATTSDNLEEVFENREQIEISKHYEKMPNPALVAIREFLDGQIYFREPETLTETTTE